MAGMGVLSEPIKIRRMLKESEALTGATKLQGITFQKAVIITAVRPQFPHVY
jgi:hypothetical protein